MPIASLRKLIPALLLATLFGALFAPAARAAECRHHNGATPPCCAAHQNECRCTAHSAPNAPAELTCPCRPDSQPIAPTETTAAPFHDSPATLCSETRLAGNPATRLPSCPALSVILPDALSASESPPRAPPFPA